MAKSALEESLALQIKAHGLPKPLREHYFAKEPPVKRMWRFDFAWRDDDRRLRVAAEVEGGTWNSTNDPTTMSRHSTGAGMRDDCVKYNQAALMGWTVLRFTVDMVRDGTAIRTIKQALDAKGAA